MVIPMTLYPIGLGSKTVCEQGGTLWLHEREGMIVRLLPLTLNSVIQIETEAAENNQELIGEQSGSR